MAEAKTPARPAAAKSPARPAGAKSTAQLRVTQVKSTIGSKHNQRETLRTLGLRKIRQSVLRDDTPSVRGMIATVRHLVTVQEVK